MYAERVERIPVAAATPFGQSAADRAGRERLLRQYLAIGARRRRYRRRFFFKQLTWKLVVGGARMAKRTLDLCGATVLALVFAPLFLVVAMLIKLDSRGPAFFRQTRVGQWGRPFRMYKFRSMRTDAERRLHQLRGKNEMAGGVIFKIRQDERVTAVGRFLRRHSLDELPQLWNVLRGEMSLVGPRPPLPSEVAEYTLAHRRRLEVRPGITCIWQVSGRSEIPFQRQVELDVEYVESQSLWLDLKLLLRTIPAVLLGYGAY